MDFVKKNAWKNIYSMFENKKLYSDLYSELYILERYYCKLVIVICFHSVDFVLVNEEQSGISKWDVLIMLDSSVFG